MPLFTASKALEDIQNSMLAVFSFCRALSENKDFKITLLLPASKNTEQDLSGFKENNFPEGLDFEVQFVSNYLNSKRISKYVLHEYAKKIRGINPDLVYSRDVKICRLAINNNIPAIVELHSPYLHNKYSLIDNLLKFRLKQLSFNKNLIEIVTVSNALKEYWKKKGLCSSKFRVERNSFDKNRLLPKLSKEESRLLLQWPLDKKIAVYTGSLWPERGTESIIHLAKMAPDIMFYIIGGPRRFRENYEKLVTEMNLCNVSFTGLVPHTVISRYLYAADVLLATFSDKIPTINYCSPLKIFEYMASGRIIIAHSYPTIAEVLTDNETAYLVRPGDLNNFKEKLMEAFSSSESKKLVANAMEIAYNQYTWEKRAERLISSISGKLKYNE